MAKKPEIVIVGGPNGVGKTTIAIQYANEHGLEYLGTDLLVSELDLNEIQAGKEFFKRLEQYLQTRKSVVIESTLSGTGLLKRIEKFREKGYTVIILFVFLDSIQLCKRRIKIRVKKGGHNVPSVDVERRFTRSIRNFWKKYRFITDSWQLYYNGSNRPIEVAFNEGKSYLIIDKGFFNKFKECVV